jgi:lipopolysaccharide biosynthesis regulator YciM
MMSAEELESLLGREMEGRGDAGAPFGLALALWRKQRGEVDLAIAQLRRLVERRPSFWEARRELGSLLLAQDRSEELRADYQEILGRLGDPAPGFSCRACHHRLPEFRFRCPLCEAWDSIGRDEPQDSVPGSPAGEADGSRPRPVI